jgi:hypothetical protein
MRELAIALLVTLTGALVGLAGTNNGAPAVASLGWLVAIGGGFVAIAYGIRALRH